MADRGKPATSARAVQLAVEHFGKLDGLCLLAGVFGPCYRLDSSDMNTWTKAMQINVLSHVHTVSSLQYRPLARIFATLGR